MERSEHSPKHPKAGRKRPTYEQVYATSNVFSAWLSVRAKARQSPHAPTREEVRQIDENPIRFVHALQRKLRGRKYAFPLQRGVIKTKRATGKKRGIVVAPLEGRVVQRSILNVLQSPDPHIRLALGDIPSHLECPTSVGGIPKRGVQHAVELIRTAILGGATYFVRSDIKGFFDNVRRVELQSYLESQIDCPDTVKLICAAFDVELSNEEEVRAEIDLFPDADLGVAQGNSLSCLAANLTLRGFDELMNGRGIVTIRYIDDFVILGKSAMAVQKAMAAGKAHLQTLGLQAYLPSESAGKASQGYIANGFDFVGCFFKGTAVAPSATSRDRFISEVDRKLFDASRAIRKSFLEGKPRRAEDRFVQTLVSLDRKIRGWGDAYPFTTERQIYSDLDIRIQQSVGRFRRWFTTLVRDSSPTQQYRAFGIALLSDTPAEKPQRVLPDGKLHVTGVTQMAEAHTQSEARP